LNREVVARPVLPYLTPMLDLTKLYLFIFGVLTIAGGVMGYVKARSVVSIVAGGISGVLLALAGYFVGTGKVQLGLILGLVVSLALAGQFVGKFLKTHKFMPAGMMSVLSIIGLVLTVASLIMR